MKPEADLLCLSLAFHTEHHKIIQLRIGRLM